MMAAKKRPEERTGAASGFADDPRFVAIAQGTSRRDGITIPKANPNWHPQARSWYNSLALSGQSDFYEASDWATAVIAAQLLDHYLRSRTIMILPQFLRLSERLGVTIIDRKRNRIELDAPDITDQDEEAADEAVVKWHGRLGLVVGGDELWFTSVSVSCVGTMAGGSWAARGMHTCAGTRLDASSREGPARLTWPGGLKRRLRHQRLRCGGHRKHTQPRERVLLHVLPAWVLGRVALGRLLARHRLRRKRSRARKPLPLRSAGVVVGELVPEVYYKVHQLHYKVPLA
jgi:hypothetical protein